MDWLLYAIVGAVALVFYIAGDAAAKKGRRAKAVCFYVLASLL